MLIVIVQRMSRVTLLCSFLFRITMHSERQNFGIKGVDNFIMEFKEATTIAATKTSH